MAQTDSGDRQQSMNHITHDLPELDCWPNRDPLGEFAGINLFLFVANNPITEKDALGLCPINCWANYVNAQAQIQQNYLNCLFAGWGITGGLHLVSGTRLSPTGLLGAPAACGAKAAHAQAQATGTYLGCLSGQ